MEMARARTDRSRESATRRTLLLAAVAVLACACPERDAEAAVRRCDDPLVRAYRTADASTLAGVAAVPAIHDSHMVRR